MCCFCFDLHRYQFHLISYGVVAFCLVSTGLVFSIFAIFLKDSELGKVWLAGPTAMVIGLVLCGKVVIDWGTAMERARANSIDTLLEQTSHTDAGRASILAMPKTQLVYPQNSLFIGTDDNVMECHNIRYSALQCSPFGFTDNVSSNTYYLPISSFLTRTTMPTSFTEPQFAASECQCGHIMANRFRTTDGSAGANGHAEPTNGGTFQGEKMFMDGSSYFI